MFVCFFDAVRLLNVDVLKVYCHCNLIDHFLICTWKLLFITFNLTDWKREASIKQKNKKNIRKCASNNSYFINKNQNSVLLSARSSTLDVSSRNTLCAISISIRAIFLRNIIHILRQQCKFVNFNFAMFSIVFNKHFFLLCILTRWSNPNQYR